MKVQKYLRGQVWWRSNTLDTATSVQSGKRPYIIISNNIGNFHSNNVIAIPCTKQEKKGQPTHFEFDMEGIKNIALCEQIETFPKRQLTDYIATFDCEIVNELMKKVLVAIGIQAASKVQGTDEASKKVQEPMQKATKTMENIKKHKSPTRYNFTETQKRDLIKYREAVRDDGKVMERFKIEPRKNVSYLYLKFCKELGVEPKDFRKKY